MASTSANADTLINVKVSLDGGITRRFRLPLRDLGANVLENRLRACLQIPADTDATIERYSDSATSYVTLDSANIAVYKQLYRAAKAKQKLRLRITTNPLLPVNDTHAPKPVTIEDEPEETPQPMPLPTTDGAPGHEASQELEGESKKQAQEETVAPTNDAQVDAYETVTAPRSCEEFTLFVRDWLARGKPRFRVRTDANGKEVIDFIPESQAANDSSITSEPASAEADIRSLGIFARILRDAASRHSASSTGEMRNRSSLDYTLPGFKSEDLSSPGADIIHDILSQATQCTVPKVESKGSPDPVPVMEKSEETQKTETVDLLESPPSSFTVCCNSCDKPVPSTHFHCSICDDGDFDLCQSCVNKGITCHAEGHWLIKRTIVDGRIECSNTQVVPQIARASVTKIPSPPAVASTFSLPIRPLVGGRAPLERNVKYNSRTCNCCVREFREEEFVHCTTCEDYDLCKGCFVKDQHGHHPRHGFAPAVKGAVLDYKVVSRLSPGRNVVHNAICDGCDTYIRGLRHKCLDCPDWDYCADCIKDAVHAHPHHRFVIIYDPLADRPVRPSSLATHDGITCDGPLCATLDGRYCRYIVGDRYKCAVCHDTDFCANCEASPANKHNKTHPLIKFKTPVRHVSVTTTGEHEDGKRLPRMGDRCHAPRAVTQVPEKPASSRGNIVATPVQTVVDLQPTEQPQAPPSSTSVSVEVKKEVAETKASAIPEPCNFVAIFKWDTIKDGSVLPPNHTFEQTWVLRNEGTVPWPAGCSVKFVGGDYMGAVDPARPAGIRELISASESTICYDAVNPGQEFHFTVLMRTPDRDGKIISYWRLTTPDGVKFGHKLWCDVTVQSPPKSEQIKVEAETGVDETKSTALTESRMIIPTLEHESPVVSVHSGQSEVEVEAETDTLAPSTDEDEGFEDCGEPDDWADESGDSFLTDEEYDILDASDEEFLFEQQKKLPKK